jgi:hypothetical protein
VKITSAVASLLFIPIYCCCAKDQADEALDQARQLAGEGKFEQALEKHIWYHNHALEIDRSYYGIRLSFALSDWVELGKKYPKALEALKDIRNKKTSRLLTGELDRSLFHDVAAINEELGQSGTTAETFKKIESVQPSFASSIYDLADKALFEAREYKLEKKYLGDANARFATAKRNLDFGIQFAKTCRNAEGSQQAFENNFTQEVIRIIVVLDKTGDRNTAQKIQSNALAVLNSPAIKDAIRD